MNKETVWYLTSNSWKDSIIGNFGLAVSLIAMVGSGAYLKSSVIEGIGLVFFFFTVFSMCTKRMGERTSFNSPQQLANEIKRRYGVTAK